MFTESVRYDSLLKWLSQYQTDAEVRKSNRDVDDYIQQYMEDAWKMYREYIVNDKHGKIHYTSAFTRYFSPEDYQHFYNTKAGIILPEFNKKVDAFTEGKFKLFTKEGAEAFQDDEYKRQVFDGLIKDIGRSAFYDMDFAMSDGYMRIYRAMNINKKANYSGVGIYWSYALGGEVAYYGSGSIFSLAGLVSMEDINWAETIFKSIYYLKKEKEITVKQGAPIKIVSYSTNGWDTEHEMFPATIKA